MLEVEKELTIRCGDCGRGLAEVVLTENNAKREADGRRPLKTRFRVDDCPYCGGKSFYTDWFDGSTAMGKVVESLNFAVTNTEYTEESSLMIVEVTLKITKKY